MIICIDTVEKCSPNDMRTPVFIFERLCSIIYPEENEIGEFYLSLEKDPQQEDFLQVNRSSKITIYKNKCYFKVSRILILKIINYFFLFFKY